MSVSGLNFGEALEGLKAGKGMARTGWNGEGMHIELQMPDENSKMTRAYLYMQTVDGGYVPWVASQTDILAQDWYEVTE